MEGWSKGGGKVREGDTKTIGEEKSHSGKLGVLEGSKMICINHLATVL